MLVSSPRTLHAGQTIGLRFCDWVDALIPPLQVLPNYRRWLLQTLHPPLLGVFTRLTFVDSMKFPLHQISTLPLKCLSPPIPVVPPRISPLASSLLFPTPVFITHLQNLYFPGILVSLQNHTEHISFKQHENQQRPRVLSDLELERELSEKHKKPEVLCFSLFLTTKSQLQTHRTTERDDLLCFSSMDLA